MLRPGRNIAVKVPLYRYEKTTVAFWRDRGGLLFTRTMENGTGFAFGELTLWIDRLPHQSQGDPWLEPVSDDPDEALERLGGPRRGELEPLDGVTGHWTCDPAGTVLLVRKESKRSQG